MISNLYGGGLARLRKVVSGFSRHDVALRMGLNFRGSELSTITAVAFFTSALTTKVADYFRKRRSRNSR